MDFKINANYLEEKLAKIESARNWHPRVISKLENSIHRPNIDYFGQPMNIAARVQGSAGGDEIYLTEAIYRAAGVRDLLQKHSCTIEALRIELKGIEGPVKIYKVAGVN